MDRSRKSRLGTGEVDRGMRHGSRPARCPAPRAARGSAGSSVGGSARRPPGCRVVAEHLSAVAPISWARSTAFTMPVANGRWAPRRRPSEASGASYDAGAMHHDLLTALRALADLARLRIAGRLAGGPASEAELAADLGLPPRAAVRRQPRQARRGGSRVGRRRRPGARATRSGPRPSTSWVGACAELEPDAQAGDGTGVGLAGEHLPTDVARVLRGYFEADRLTTIPGPAGPSDWSCLRYPRDRCFTEDRLVSGEGGQPAAGDLPSDVAALRRVTWSTRGC